MDGDSGIAELETLFPTGRVVVLGGLEIEVRPLKARQLAPFARAMAPILDALNHLRAEGQPADVADLGTWVDLAMDYSADLITALAAATERSVEEIGEVNVYDLALLAAEVMAANQDFFLRRLMPVLMAILQKATASAGPIPASDSAPSATIPAT